MCRNKELAFSVPFHFPTHTMPPRLDNLPLELIHSIISYSEPEDVGSLRRVCRSLESRVREYFSNTHFTRVSINLSSSSLRRLKGISTTRHLAPRVKVLHIGYGDGMGEGLQWRRYLEGHLKFPNDGTTQLQSMLVKNLVNCRSIEVDAYDEIEEQKRVETEILTPSDALSIIWTLMAKGGVTFKSISVHSDCGTLMDGNMDTRRLQLPLCNSPEFIESLGDLRDLDLSFAMTRDQYHWALDLIWRAPRLESLALGFHDCSATIIKKLTEHLIYAQLKKITLYGASASQEVMWTCLEQQRNTLSALHIERNRIDGGGSWAAVFKNLIGMLPHLRNIKILELEQSRAPGTRSSYLTFSNPLANLQLQSDSFGNIPESYYCFITGLQRMARLSYRASWKAVVGVEYQASDTTDMDQMLMLLKESIKIVTSSRRR